MTSTFNSWTTSIRSKATKKAFLNNFTIFMFIHLKSIRCVHAIHTHVEVKNKTESANLFGALKRKWLREQDVGGIGGVNESGTRGACFNSERSPRKRRMSEVAQPAGSIIERLLWLPQPSVEVVIQWIRFGFDRIYYKFRGFPATMMHQWLHSHRRHLLCVCVWWREIIEGDEGGRGCWFEILYIQVGVG